MLALEMLLGAGAQRARGEFDHAQRTGPAPGAETTKGAPRAPFDIASGLAA